MSVLGCAHLSSQSLNQIVDMNPSPRFPLTTFQFPLDGIAEEVRPLLAIVQNGVNPVQGSGWESGRGLLVIDPLASHAL